MGKTTVQKGAHVVKDCIRHKNVYATAVGGTTKAYLGQRTKENFTGQAWCVGSILGPNPAMLEPFCSMEPPWSLFGRLFCHFNGVCKLLSKQMDKNSILMHKLAPASQNSRACEPGHPFPCRSNAAPDKSPMPQKGFLFPGHV